MAAGTLTPNVESDPVAVALADAGVGTRLLAAARAFLLPRARRFSFEKVNAEAEEIVSRARVKAWEKRATYDGRRDVVNWLIKYVFNTTRDYVKQHNRESAATSFAPLLLEDLKVDARPTAIDALMNEELRTLLAQSVACLPMSDRELIRLKYDESLTFTEIAEREGSNANALRVRFHRLITRLRELLGEKEGQP